MEDQRVKEIDIIAQDAIFQTQIVTNNLFNIQEKQIYVDFYK